MLAYVCFHLSTITEFIPVVQIQRIMVELAGARLTQVTMVDGDTVLLIAQKPMMIHATG